MKFYIATRYSDKILRKYAISIKDTLEAEGHVMTFDWMNGEDVRPYGNNLIKTQKNANAALNGATEADFFILIPHPNGTGMYVEFGAAIAQFEKTGRPQIYILGEHKDCSIFNFHPATNWVDSLEEIIEKLEN